MLQAHHIQNQYDMWTFPHIQENDTHIMNVLMDLKYSGIQLQQINACRMYLQINMLSEMTNHTGTILLLQVMNPMSSQPPQGLDAISHLLFDWPTIHKPSIKCWKLWTHTIQMVFTGSTKGTQLQQPLGEWFEQHQHHRFWHWRYAPSGRLLHSSNPTQCTCMAIQTTATHCYLSFSLLIPTNQQFEGAPVTPLDKSQRCIDLLIPMLAHTPDTQHIVPHF